VEVWNYDKSAKIGSLLIKSLPKAQTYAFEFKKSNLLIEITPQFLLTAVNSQTGKVKRAESLNSTETDASSDREL
jgi:hypothetical protein